jgi:AcrR family transcriptional regulator
MSAVNPESRRAYRSSLRAAQSQLTRERVLEAALRRMSERGYASTTVADIAAEADVAVDTIYKAFGSKVGVVEALIAAARPGAAIEGLRRDWAAADGRPAEQLRIYVRGMAGFWSLNSGLAWILRHGVGDGEVAALWAERQATRRAVAASLFGTWGAGARRQGISAATAVDLVWAMTSVDSFHALVIDAGWTRARWEREISAALARAILA